MKTKQNKKTLAELILEKLLSFAESYAQPLSYQETEIIYLALGPIGKVVKHHHYKQALKRLHNRGLIRIGTGPKIKIIVTAKGKKYLRNLKKPVVIKKPAKWDGKWRLVIFDVPEIRRQKRDSFRYHLRNLGLTQVQESVWAYPYPCEKEITAVLEICDVKEFTSIFTGTYSGDDQELRKIF